jgi:hypothetical protein
MQKIRTIAIYLPQFHSIPENDEWWGKGFTEWTNVMKSVPLFRGHKQPNSPHQSIGYYDLASPDVIVKQAYMAQEYGINGFAFYHYWFKGKQLLELPVNNILKSGVPDFPFCLFWANETWSKRWLGEEKEILIKQTYSEEDDAHHIKWLIGAFKDSRYIKINDRPVFIIYRPFDIPDIRKTLSFFASECLKEGIERPYFISSNSHTGDVDLREYGFDGIMNFEPQLGVLNGYLNDKVSLKKLLRNLKLGVISSKLKIYNYSLAKKRMSGRTFSYPFYPCACVRWDNSPRRGRNGIILKNSNPMLFRRYFIESVRKLKEMNFTDEENLIFINAWNEWAEGNYLEPDNAFGFKYLEAVKEVLESF